ncbi:MAG: hypothetical protein SF187_07485 [Deltaproteobacteria bacterium]|nr:hypothetical protein [Deltaproteobacteria bacterium]
MTASPACPLPNVQLPPQPQAYLIIDDLEDGDNLTGRTGGLGGNWEIWDDDSAKPTASVSNTCAALGKYAMHLSTTGQTGWGASASVFFAAPPHPSPFNGSGWNAISFYMALSPNDTRPRTFRASVSTMETAWNGRCTSCVDNFGTGVAVTGRWQRFVLPFADLRQMGWGVPPASFKLDEIVQFHVALDQKFDVWIDHIQFERL